MLTFALLLRPGGYSSGSWRVPGSRIEEATQLQLFADVAAHAEAAGVDALFFADSLALPTSAVDHISQPLEPLTLVGALAALTSRIGFIATASTTYNEPYNLARQFATLDHLSSGRVGWNVVTTAAGDEVARNFGRDRHLAHDTRYARADEFQTAVKALWLSWDRDAIRVDRDRGVQTADNSIHPVDYVGAHLSVAGPLNVPRPPQQWPLMAHAGQSAEGLDVAQNHAELIFSVQHDVTKAAQFKREVAHRLQAQGRPAHGIKVLPGLIPIIGETAEAAAELDSLYRELGGESDSTDELSWVLGYDVRTADQDHVVTAADLSNPDQVQGGQSWYRQIQQLVTEYPQTVGELRTRLSTVGRFGHFRVVGTPEQVADELAAWHDSGAADGFVVQLPVLPGVDDLFLNRVLPILRDRGYVPPLGAAPTTLRERLGLPSLPENFPTTWTPSIAGKDNA
ncbi:MAG: NtaA/DmoA family FMN-dependent monooxygenase [Mycetocola sp.]